MIGVAVGGLVIGEAARRLRPGGGPGAGAAAVALAVAPVPAASIGLLHLAAARWRRSRRRTRRVQAEVDACMDAGELIALGLAGGLSVAASYRLAAQNAEPAARPALERLVARISELGTAPALLGDRGPTRPLAHALGAAAVIGAPALPALRAQLDAEIEARRQRRVEAMRRLPIRMLVPLALLVLPGFVLTVVGPVLIEALARLSL